MKFAMAVVALAGMSVAAPSKPNRETPFHDLTHLAYANAYPVNEKHIQHDTRAAAARPAVKDNRKLKYKHNVPMAIVQ